MATKIAAPGGGNWTAGATWVGGVAPLASDDAQLTATSGNVTIDTGAVARSLDCTGFTGVLTHNNTALNLGDATAGAGNVALKLVAGMTYAATPGGSYSLSFVSTSATQQTITTAGKSFGNVAFAGIGGNYLLADGLTNSSVSAVTLSAGTFNTGNFTMSLGLFLLSGASAKTLTLGSSAITITGNSTTAVTITGSNITFTANTAVFTFTGASAGTGGGGNWNGTSLVFTSSVTVAASISSAPIWTDVTYNGPANKVATLSISTGVTTTITGILTIAGNSTVNRILVRAGTTGSAATVSAATVSLSNVDFIDITAAGAAGTWTGTSMGNALGNTNITFDTPATQTRSGAGGLYSAVGQWTSRVPLPQDNVIIGAAASGTITMDMPRLGADVTFAGFTGTAGFTSVATTMYGSLTLGSGMTITGSNNVTWAARSAKTITSNGKAWPNTNTIVINAIGGTYTHTDAFTWGSFISLAAGSWVTAGFPIVVDAFSSFGGTRSVTLGTSVITLNRASAGAAWDTDSSLTVSAASSTIVLATASANARNFNGGGKTYGTLTYTVPGSTGSLTITGANTFGTINFSDASNARSLLFTAGTTTFFTAGGGGLVATGTPGKLMNVDSATAANHTLSKTSGVVSGDYLNVAHSQAGGGAAWYAGSHSVNGGNNIGWIFEDASRGNFYLMF